MKVKIQFIALVLMLIILSACNNMREKTTEDILENKILRKNIISAISNDSTMMNQMMEQMMENEYSMKMMAHNHSMMKEIIGDPEKMTTMLSEDTAMVEMMMDNMMHAMGNDSMMYNKMCGMMKYDKRMMSMKQGGKK